MNQMDDDVAHANLSSRARKQPEAERVPVTDVHLNPAASTFRQAMNVAYLTLEQKVINDSAVCAIIEGPAGSGKTLLVQAKVLQLVQDKRSAPTSNVTSSVPISMASSNTRFFMINYNMFNSIYAVSKFLHCILQM